MEGGKDELLIKVEILGKGFDTIEQGLDKLMRGVVVFGRDKTCSSSRDGHSN